MTQSRINKFIASSGHCSRRQADELIEAGEVKINDRVAKLGDTVGQNDVITIGKKTIGSREQDIYIAFNKPVGVISTLDPEAENSVLDYVKTNDRFFYVGRLDVLSSGLMLLTNNGDVANKITRSEEDHEKEYVVTVDKKMTRRFIDSMRSGVNVKNTDGEAGPYVTKPARIKKLSDNRFNIILTESKNRQIRNMCKALGYSVKKLKRIRIMNIKLRELGDGNWRYLSSKERRELLEALKTRP
ncbi:MAG: pseudouridine synthase [Candidatus Uhrbacteria bacterium]|nr:pseudouridine synthase [Candidatus Uhrbacteria bacterium]